MGGVGLVESGHAHYDAGDTASADRHGGAEVIGHRGRRITEEIDGDATRRGRRLQLSGATVAAVANPSRSDAGPLVGPAGEHPCGALPRVSKVIAGRTDHDGVSVRGVADHRNRRAEMITGSGQEGCIQLGQPARDGQPGFAHPSGSGLDKDESPAFARGGKREGGV